jgi:hypothetical protein
MMTVLAYVGKFGVDRCPKRKLSGSECQNESVGLGTGSEQGWLAAGFVEMDDNSGITIAHPADCVL